MRQPAESCRFPGLNPRLGQHDLGLRHRQSDDVGLRTGQAGDERIGVLDAVGAGFSLPLAGFDVTVEFLRGNLPHVDGGHHLLLACEIGRAMNDGHAGDDNVGGAGKDLQNPPGVGGVFGFADDPIAECDDRVGAENDGIGKLRATFSAFPSDR